MAKKILLTESGGRFLAEARAARLTGRLLVQIDPRVELESVLKGLKGKKIGKDRNQRRRGSRAKRCAKLRLYP